MGTFIPVFNDECAHSSLVWSYEWHIHTAERIFVIVSTSGWAAPEVRQKPVNMFNGMSFGRRLA